MIRISLFYFILYYVCFVSFLNSCVHGHEQPGLKCSKAERRPFLTYHIHALFWQSNNNSVSAATGLKTDFGEHFGINEEMNRCNFEAGDVEPQQTELCFFETSMEPSGPFLTGISLFHFTLLHFSSSHITTDF